jgi:tetratricopeptide (TPR) repeat protein
MSQQLVQLIKTLTRNEKRYVNLNLKAFSFDEDSNKILADFNKIEKQIGLKKIKSELIITGNSTRLYYKIIDILYQFHEEELPNTDESLKNLKRAKLLIFKGLYQEGIKILNKIINYTSRYDYLIKMESLELKLNSAIKYVDIDYLNTDYPKDKVLFSQFHKEYYNLMEFESMEALIKLESTTLYFYGDDHYITKIYRRLLENEDNAFHPLAKIYFNKANAFLALKRRDLDTAYKYAKRTLQLFEKYPDIKIKNLISYLKSIRNFCIVQIHLHKFKEAEDLLTEFEPALLIHNKFKTIDVKTELFTLFVLLRMDIIISNNTITENITRLKFFESEFRLNAELLRDDEKASSYLNLTLLNFHIKNYRQALKYTIQALKIAGKVRRDIFNLSLMNELVLHYFLGNTEVLFSKLNAYKRFIAKGDLMFGFEKELPTLLTTIFNNPQNSSSFKKLFDTINQSLIEEDKQVYKNFISLFYLKTL